MSDLVTSHWPLEGCEVPQGWELVSLSQFVANIQTGFASGKHNSEGNGVPHLRPMNISPRGEIDLEDGRFVDPDKSPLRLKRGDVLFNNTNSPAWVGKTAYIDTDSELAFSNHMTRLRMTGDVNSRFVAEQLQFLCQSGYFLQQCKKHVNQASINRGFLSDSTPFLLPPKTEQSRIVSAIDSLRERSSRARVLLSEVGLLIGQLRQSVLTGAFNGRLTTDWRAARATVNSFPEKIGLSGPGVAEYDLRHQDSPQAPSRNASERGKEEAETAQELLPHIRTERRELWEAAELAKMATSGRIPDNDKWKNKLDAPTPIGNEVELYELPDSWEWISFDEVTATSLYGPRFGADEYDPSGIPTVRTTDMDFYGNIRLSNPPRVLIKDHQRDHLLLQKDDLVITRTGATIGKAALFDEAIGDAIASAYLIRYRLTRETVLPKFIHYLLLSPFGQKQLLNGSQAVAQPNINTKKIAAFAVPLPPLHEQREIVRSLDESLKMMDNVTAIQASLESSLMALDQSILLKAFRGELVNQDPRDEPAAELLARIQDGIKKLKVESIKNKQKKQPTKSKASYMNDNHGSLLRWIKAQKPKSSFTFEDLVNKVSLKYEDTREQLFSLLDEKRPYLKQTFDKTSKTILFCRTAKK